MMPEPFASMPNTDLIEACLKGNSSAWEALLVRYQGLIYSIPLRYGLPIHDADDIFQDVSLLLLENLERLRDRQQLGAWLATTTRRECWRLLYQRRQNAGSGYFDDEQASGSPHSDEALIELERQSIIRSAVDLLGASCRHLLTLLFYADPRPSYTEIAHTLSLPEGSIGPTRARCLAKLIRILDRMSFLE